LYRNQYLITDRSCHIDPSLGSRGVTVGPWTVHAVPPLQVVRSGAGGTEAALIGLAVDPLLPTAEPSALLHQIIDGASNAAEAADRAASLTGRFVVILHAKGRTHVFGDACHLRSILWGRLEGRTLIGSSEKLMLTAAGTTLQMSEDKLRFRASPLHLRSESAWVGTNAYDNRLQRVLPNHLLEVETGEVCRLPLVLPDEARGEPWLIDVVRQSLKGAMAALAPRFKLVQPVTAGWDSRMLLAASLPVKQSIEYYLFVREGDPGTQADARIARTLQKALDLNFREIVPNPVTEEFLGAMSACLLFPRALQKSANIQHHASRPDRDRVVNVNGNGAEVARCYYGLPRREPSFGTACHLLGYGPGDAFVARALRPWYEEARQVCRRSGIALADLLYWEQRMGNWGAMMPQEQDIAIEEVSPFNNRRLLLALLGHPARRRCGPDHPFFAQLIRAMTSEAAAIPINPHVPTWRKRVAGSALATAGGKIIKHLWVDWRSALSR
jgi:hypothetical protein